MKIVQYISLAFIGLVQPVVAQEVQLLNNGIIIQHQSIKQEGNSIVVSFLLDAKQLELSSTRSLTLTPVLVNGETKKALTPMLFNGANRHKVYRRHMALGVEDPNEFYVVEKANKKVVPVHYTETIAFEPWMKEANLWLVEDYCGCGGHTAQTDREKLNTAPFLLPSKPYEAQLIFCYGEPQKEKQKSRTTLKDVYLNFPVNKIIIYPDYMNNQSELNQVQQMIEKMNSDCNLTIRQIMLRGYASPEGSVSSNCRLSEGRAAALKNYLLPRLHNNKLPMFSESGCEDWEGTIELLEKSNIADRTLLLEAIRKCDRSDIAEMKLRTLNNGAPYADMLREVYPKVRRVVCSVDYTVREFTVEEGRKLIEGQPELLSLHELYQVAFSYPGNSPEFLAAFHAAERAYPNHQTSLLNGAIVALAEGNLDRAEANLQKVTTHDPIYLNTQGILLTRRGQKEEALKSFRQAAEQGLETARLNLAELEKTMK